MGLLAVTGDTQLAKKARPRGAELSTVTIPLKSLRANFNTREPVKHGGKKALKAHTYLSC
jgi:hypothetical protein